MMVEALFRLVWGAYSAMMYSSYAKKCHRTRSALEMRREASRETLGEAMASAGVVKVKAKHLRLVGRT